MPQQKSVPHAMKAQTYDKDTNHFPLSSQVKLIEKVKLKQEKENGKEAFQVKKKKLAHAKAPDIFGVD